MKTKENPQELFERMKNYLIQEGQLTEAEIEELEKNCYREPKGILPELDSSLDYYYRNFGFGSTKDDVGISMPDEEDRIRYQKLCSKVSRITSVRKLHNLSKIISNLESRYIKNPQQDERKAEIGKKALGFLLENIGDTLRSRLKDSI